MSSRTAKPQRERGPLVRCTAEELKNSWTNDSLEKYLQSCSDNPVEFAREIVIRSESQLVNCRRAPGEA